MWLKQSRKMQVISPGSNLTRPTVRGRGTKRIPDAYLLAPCKRMEILTAEVLSSTSHGTGRPAERGRYGEHRYRVRCAPVGRWNPRYARDCTKRRYLQHPESGGCSFKVYYGLRVCSTV
jgi:hypothetical protein